MLVSTLDCWEVSQAGLRSWSQALSSVTCLPNMLCLFPLRIRITSMALRVLSRFRWGVWERLVNWISFVNRLYHRWYVKSLLDLFSDQPNLQFTKWTVRKRKVLLFVPSTSNPKIPLKNPFLNAAYSQNHDNESILSRQQDLQPDDQILWFCWLKCRLLLVIWITLQGEVQKPFRIEILFLSPPFLII